MGKGMILTSIDSNGVVRGVVLERFFPSSQALTVTFSNDMVQVGGDFGDGRERLEGEKDESLDMDDEVDSRNKDDEQE